MKRIRYLITKIKTNKLLLIILLLLISVPAVYSATILFQANEVGYDNTETGFKDSNNEDVEDVQTALDELYAKASSCSIRNICPSGYAKINGSDGEYSCIKKHTPKAYIQSLNTEGVSISTTDHTDELRFIGANPNNYVTFNNQTWRIIGVFNGKLKLISPSIGAYSYDTSAKTVNNGLGVNAWEDADLMKLLNPGYSTNTDLKCKTNTSSATENGYTVINCGDNTTSAYEETNPLVNNSLYWDAGQGLCYTYGNYQAASCDFRSSGLTDTNSKNMIDNTTWYLGSNNKNDDLWGANQIMTASYLYNMERSSYTGKQCSNTNYCSDTVTRNDPPTWTGKVGLLYPSDYAYATSGGNTYDRDTCLSKQVGYVSANTTPNWQNTYTDCLSNDWLFTGSHTWTLSPRAYSGHSYRVFFVSASGYVNNNIVMYAFGVRPVVYLKSNVKITGGEGTSANPFVLSYESE